MSIENIKKIEDGLKDYENQIEDDKEDEKNKEDEEYLAEVAAEKEKEMKHIDYILDKKLDWNVVGEYYNRTFFFDKEGNLNVFEEERSCECDKPCVHDVVYQFMSKEDFKNLNDDSVENIIGNFETFYLRGYGDGASFGVQIVDSLEEAQKNWLDTSYANPKSKKPDIVREFKIALIKKGNPVVEIDRPTNYEYEADYNYGVKIENGILTPENALKSNGDVGFYFREKLVGLVKKRDKNN